MAPDCGSLNRSSRQDKEEETHMTITDYLVAGMTCKHCIASVTEELTELDSVEEVNVELHVGALSRVRVTSSEPLDDAAVRDAIGEAGYELSSTRETS